MGEHPNARLGRRIFESLGAGDDDAMMEAFTDDVIWHAPGTNRFSGRFDGKDAVRERFGRMRASGISPRSEVHDVVANDEHVVALVHLHVESPGGERYDQPQVQVMHVRDGRISELWSMNQDQAVLDLLMGS
jgi:ketosteroid isomerase-like protein